MASPCPLAFPNVKSSIKSPERFGPLAAKRACELATVSPACVPNFSSADTHGTRRCFCHSIHFFQLTQVFIHLPPPSLPPSLSSFLSSSLSFFLSSFLHPFSWTLSLWNWQVYVGVSTRQVSTWGRKTHNALQKTPLQHVGGPDFV